MDVDKYVLGFDVTDTSGIFEYRIVLPLSVEEYRIGQLHATCEASKEETGGGDGIEVVINEPREENQKGQYTHKILHITKKLPVGYRKLAPSGFLQFHEKSFNSYPLEKTGYSNDYMKNDFHVVIDSQHFDGVTDDDNVFGLTPEELSKRVVDRIDIVNDKLDPCDYKEEEDPTKFRSTKTSRGPFTGSDWQKGNQPMMTIYKLYRIKSQWRGLHFVINFIEPMILRAVRRILQTFQRKVVCSMDKWLGTTIEDIRKLEAETKPQLDDLRQQGDVQGMIVK